MPRSPTCATMRPPSSHSWTACRCSGCSIRAPSTCRGSSRRSWTSSSTACGRASPRRRSPARPTDGRAAAQSVVAAVYFVGVVVVEVFLVVIVVIVVIVEVVVGLVVLRELIDVDAVDVAGVQDRRSVVVEVGGIQVFDVVEIRSLVDRTVALRLGESGLRRLV